LLTPLRLAQVKTQKTRLVEKLPALATKPGRQNRTPRSSSGLALPWPGKERLTTRAAPIMLQLENWTHVHPRSRQPDPPPTFSAPKFIDNSRTV